MSQAPSASLPVVVAPPVLAELAARQADVTILDVRTPAEYESAHIPSSYNVPLDLLPEHAGDLGATTGSPIFLVCRSGARARQAEQVLSEQGFPRLHILDGGLAAWESAGLPLNRGRQRWSLERQVRGVAGALVLVGAIGGLTRFRPLGMLAAGVGGGLLFSAVTDTCGMAMVLTKLPYNRSVTCDVGATIRALSEDRSATSPLAAD